MNLLLRPLFCCWCYSVEEKVVSEGEAFIVMYVFREKPYLVISLSEFKESLTFLEKRLSSF